MKALFVTLLVSSFLSLKAQNQEDNIKYITDVTHKQFVWANNRGDSLYIGISNDQGLYRIVDSDILFYNTKQETRAVCHIYSTGSKIYYIKQDLPHRRKSLQTSPAKKTGLLVIEDSSPNKGDKISYKSTNYTPPDISDTIAVFDLSAQTLSVTNYGNYYLKKEDDNCYVFSNSTEDFISVDGVDKVLAAFFFVHDYLPKENLRNTIKKMRKTGHQ